jgi:zinc protease
LVDKYFAPIPGGDKPTRQPRTDPPKLTGVRRETMTDHVELAKLIFVYHSPAKFADGDAQLDLLASELSSGRASRLYKALVYDKPLAQDVVAVQESQDLGSLFRIEVTARPETDLDVLEKEVDKILDEAVKRAPTEAEMKRAQNELEFGYVARLQSMAARASLMNQYQVAFGEPDGVERDLARYRTSTSASVFDWAKKTLTKDARLIVRVLPEKKAAASPTKTTKVAPKPKKVGAK